MHLSCRLAFYAGLGCSILWQQTTTCHVDACVINRESEQDRLLQAGQVAAGGGKKSRHGLRGALCMCVLLF